MKTAKFYIVHDERALLGRYLRYADAVRLQRSLGADVRVTPEAAIFCPHLLARLAHWVEIDKRGCSKLL